MMGNNSPSLPVEILALAEKIKSSSKYRNYAFLDDTLLDVLSEEHRKGGNISSVEKRAKRKIHNITALYLGDPDYTDAARKIQNASKIPNSDGLLSVVRDIMGTHLSTRERLDFLEEIYTWVFSITGQPTTIMDLACGLHPLSFPWMGLPDSTLYHAYDIHKERIEFLNQFQSAIGIEPLSELLDVISTPPTIKADVVFILKEIHRFEQRKRGCSLNLLEKLNSKFIVASFPVRNEQSGHKFSESYHRFFTKIISPKSWEISETTIGNEMFFLIDKGSSQ